MARIFSRLGPALQSSPLGSKAVFDKHSRKIEDLLTDIIAAVSSMPDITDVTIQADYTGTVLDGQLPYTVQAQRFTGSTDNTTDATWSFATDNGGITATITDGALEITDITATTVVTITSSYDGVDKSRSFVVYFDTGAAPSTGSAGGTSATDTTFASFNSTTHAAVSDELTVTIGSTGQAQLSAPLTVRTDLGTPIGTFPIYAKWQWWNGATWADVGTEVQSDPDCSVSGASGGRGSAGSVSVSQMKTGLTASATEKFRLAARNSSGTRTMYLSGTATAVGQ